MTTSWAVYDLKADDVIAVWDDYQSCVTFCLDNQNKDDSWEIFCGYDCYLPFKEEV